MKKLFVVLVLMAAVGGVYAQSALISMSRVRGGAFMMGSPVTDSNRDRGETPQHEVTVSNFLMGKYPVTQTQYQQVMGVNPSIFKGNNLPVENVSWYDAIEYCNALSRRESLTPAYTIDKERSDPNNKGGSYDSLRWIVTWDRNANGYRLPTEAEWEYACRAGTTTPHSGASVDTMAWYLGNSGARTHPAGEKQPNRWGLYDMHGNVWEWCWDWYGNYSSAAQTNPTGVASGFYRIYRGGNWQSTYSDMRSAVRGRGTPSDLSSLLGFRVVQNAPGNRY